MLDMTIAYIHATEPLHQSAAMVIDPLLFQTWPTTHHWLNDRVFVCSVHLISVLVSLSLTHERLVQRSIAPPQPKDFPAPAVPLHGVRIPNRPYFLPGPAKSQRLQAQVSQPRGATYLPLLPRTACRDPVGPSLAKIGSHRATRRRRELQILFRLRSQSAGLETPPWSAPLRRLVPLR